ETSWVLGLRGLGNQQYSVTVLGGNVRLLVEVLPIAELLLRISGVGGPELHLDADKSSTTVPDQYVESSGAVSVAVEYRQLAAEGEWSASVSIGILGPLDLK